MPRDNGYNRQANLLLNSALAAHSTIVFAVLAAGLPASAARNVLLVGPPVSGRTTQAAFFDEDLGMTSVPADTPIARSPQKFQQYNAPILQGVNPRLDPAFDNVVRTRLSSQTRPELEQELKDYHREFDFMREYFPVANIHAVGATRKPEAAKEIRKIVQCSKN